MRIDREHLTTVLKTVCAPVGALGGCLLLCLGMYAGASVIAENRFERAIKEAETAVAETRAGAFHYNALSAKEQMIYDAITSAAETYEEQTEILSFVPTGEEYTRAMQAVLLDNPVLFAIRAEECTLVTSTYTAAVEMVYCEVPEARAAQLSGAVDKITAGIAKTEDKRVIADALHDALAAVCTYPMEDGACSASTSTSTAYDALVTGVADGYGYALAYQLLCEEMGIECETVPGTAGGASHAWNAVTLDGVVGYTDVMWDDAPAADDADTHIPFHGYSYLSYGDMSCDHIADNALLWRQDDTQDYYEYHGLYAANADDTARLLCDLADRARAEQGDTLELCIGEMVSDYVLEEYLASAIAAANATSYDGDVPRLRSVNRIYHASETRCALTVRLFFEE